MTKVNTIKVVSKLVVGHGVGMVVRKIIDHNTEAKNAYEAAFLFVGRVGIASLVTHAMDNQLETTIDKAVEYLRDNNITILDEDEETE